MQVGLRSLKCIRLIIPNLDLVSDPSYASQLARFCRPLYSLLEAVMGHFFAVDSTHRGRQTQRWAEGLRVVSFHVMWYAHVIFLSFKLLNY